MSLTELCFKVAGHLRHNGATPLNVSLLLLVLEKKIFENNDHMHVYTPGAGADNPLGSEFSYKNKPVVILVICCKLFCFVVVVFFQIK